jgi:ABC-type proline/glycine betaine transport system substrate-binding protein
VQPTSWSAILIILETALASNDIQVFGEEDERSEVWKGRSGCCIAAIGSLIIGAVQGWYVPRYVVEGDAKRNQAARAPDLKTVADLTTPRCFVTRKSRPAALQPSGRLDLRTGNTEMLANTV